MKRTESYLSLLNPSRLKTILSFGIKGYLSQIGWFRAHESLAPVDSFGEPIPWVTYSFIDFISERINHTQTVFEFGSGNSTFYYAKRAAKVISVEHDKAWFDKISANRPENSEMIFTELVDGGDYCKVPLSIARKFDIIIVDGRDRVNCCLQSLNALSERGVLVLDDSERPQYQTAIRFFKDHGFRELAFSGISPGLFYRKTTSVFYKDGNCLGI